MILQWLFNTTQTTKKCTCYLPLSYSNSYCMVRQHNYNYTGESQASTREISAYIASLSTITYWGYDYIEECFITIGY